jgi:ATP synthase protein I
MSSDIIMLIKKVSLYDMIIGVLVTLMIYVVFADFTVPLLIGLVVAITNFIISSIVTDLLLNKSQGKYMILYLLSFIVRTTLISLIGFVLYTYNKYNVLPFIGGYMIHLIGISIYSLTKKI